MHDLRDIKTRLRNELEQWFIKQTHNPFEDYYLYYLESTPEHDGGLLIAREKPVNTEYQMAGGGKINKGATVDQNFNVLMATVMGLPILSIIN